MLEQLTAAALAQYGAYALPIIGLAWGYFMERKRADRERDRADKMFERLIRQTKDYLEQAGQRETATLMQLEKITSYITGRNG